MLTENAHHIKLTWDTTWKKNIIEEAHLTNSQGFLVISAENGHKIKLIWEITLKKDIYVYSIIILSLQFSQTKSETWVSLPKS